MVAGVTYLDSTLIVRPSYVEQAAAGSDGVNLIPSSRWDLCVFFRNLIARRAHPL